MLFNIAPQNAEKAKRAFTSARPAHVYGYTKSAILTPKNPRMKCCYQIDILHDIIVCTIRHQEAETVEAVFTARAFTDNSIEIERAELYRNASNYPYRTETNDRYMRKYDQIACIIHGAISAGLLFDVSEKPQETTRTTTAQDTTLSQTEPPRATDAAKTGHAAGVESVTDTSTQANQTTGTAASDTGITAGAIMGNTAGVISGTAADNPGHGCEIAPGRKERRKAEHVPIAATKSPPRAKTRDGRRTSRGSPDRRKGTFSGGMSKMDHIYWSILGVPIFNQNFRKNRAGIIQNFSEIKRYGGL